MVTPNRIVLIARGRYDEAPANATVYPGMFLSSDSASAVGPANTLGAGGQLLVATENALAGGDITQPAALSGNVCPFYRPARGDLFLMLLQLGQNVPAQTPLMSAGDGTLIINPGVDVYEITAPSSPNSNSTATLTFSNGSYTIPANTLVAGDVLRISGQATVTAQNSTNTHTVVVSIGSDSLASTGAVQMAAADTAKFDISVTLRTVGASGTIYPTGSIFAGSSTITQGTIGPSASLDTTVAEPIKVTSAASAASTGNSIRLDVFQIDLIHQTGSNTIVYSAEAINNSVASSSISIGGGSDSAAFIRCLIP